MDAQFFSNERWAEICRSIEIFDATKNRDELDRVLISMLEDLVEHFDDEENQLFIFSLGNEIGQMKYRNGEEFGFCCKIRRIGATERISTNFSDFLIDVARARTFDAENSGFVAENFLRQIVGERTEPSKIERIFRNSLKNRQGKINYFEFFLDLIEASS